MSSPDSFHPGRVDRGSAEQIDRLREEIENVKNMVIGRMDALIDGYQHSGTGSTNIQNMVGAYAAVMNSERLPKSRFPIANSSLPTNVNEWVRMIEVSRLHMRGAINHMALREFDNGLSGPYTHYAAYVHDHRNNSARIADLEKMLGQAYEGIIDAGTDKVDTFLSKKGIPQPALEGDYGPHF